MTKAGWTRPDNARVVVLLDKADVERIDQMGMEAGMPSRAATVRKLLDSGIRASMAQKNTAEAVATVPAE